MANIVLNNQREKFLEQVGKFLSTCQFTKQDDSFVREVILRGPGHQIIINGRIISHNGPSCPLKFIIDSLGQCEVMDNGDKFDMFHFSVHADCYLKQEYKYVCGMSHGFYYDELLDFQRFTLAAFKLL